MNYEDIIEKLEEISINLETYNDYPKAATNNAKRAIKWKKENGSTCGTKVGWTRANQLANRKIYQETLLLEWLHLKDISSIKMCLIQKGVGV